jgi:Nucleotidyltransferase domain
VVEDLVGVAIALVAKHPAVRRVELAGSRSRGTHEELSDWDFAVETSDFAPVARDLPTMVAPLDPLAEQWEPMGHFPVYRLLLRGPTKLEYLFLEQSQDAMPPVSPSRETLVAVNTHFWD